MPIRRPIIVSQKHENAWSNIGQNASSAIKVVIAKATEYQNLGTATPEEVAIGSRVGALYLEFHFSAETITNTKVIHWQVVKEPFNTNPTNPILYNQDNKRFIFKRGMEMLPKDVATVFKRIVIVRIPPKFRRMGQNDQITFQYQCSLTETINACGISIYKEYT